MYLFGKSLVSEIQKVIYYESIFHDEDALSIYASFYGQVEEVWQTRILKQPIFGIEGGIKIR